MNESRNRIATGLIIPSFMFEGRTVLRFWERRFLLRREKAEYV